MLRGKVSECNRVSPRKAPGLLRRADSCISSLGILCSLRKMIEVSSLMVDLVQAVWVTSDRHGCGRHACQKTWVRRPEKLLQAPELHGSLDHEDTEPHRGRTCCMKRVLAPKRVASGLSIVYCHWTIVLAICAARRRSMMKRRRTT